MDLPTKKKTESTVAQVLAWHPNFRNYERLPDIKVVRTAFFINTVAISLVVAFVAFVGFKEYQLFSLEKQIADAQFRISRDSASSAKQVQLYKEFQAGEARAKKVVEFQAARPLVSTIFNQTAETLPPYIAVTALEIREKTMSLRGLVRGSPDLAAGRANAYVVQLRKDPKFAELFDEISLAGMNPNPADGRLMIELSLKFKTPKK